LKGYRPSVRHSMVGKKRRKETPSLFLQKEGGDNAGESSCQKKKGTYLLSTKSREGERGTGVPFFPTRNGDSVESRLREAKRGRVIVEGGEKAAVAAAGERMEKERRIYTTVSSLGGRFDYDLPKRYGKEGGVRIGKERRKD